MFWIVKAFSLTELLRSLASLAVLSLLPWSRGSPRHSLPSGSWRVVRSPLISSPPCCPIAFPQLFPLSLVPLHSTSALLWSCSRTSVSFLQCCWSLFLVYPIVVCWYTVMLESIADYWWLSLADRWLSCRISSILNNKIIKQCFKIYRASIAWRTWWN